MRLPASTRRRCPVGPADRESVLGSRRHSKGNKQGEVCAVRRIICLFVLAGIPLTLALGGSPARRERPARVGSRSARTMRSSVPRSTHGGGLRRRLHWPRRALGAVLLEHAPARGAQRLPADLADRSADPSQRRTGQGPPSTSRPHPAFWFGMAMCDDQSGPNPGGARSAQAAGSLHAEQRRQHLHCTRPGGPTTSGKHPGTAFMEMQFYPPGGSPWPAGASCDATKWCAALNILQL